DYTSSKRATYWGIEGRGWPRLPMVRNFSAFSFECRKLSGATKLIAPKAPWMRELPARPRDALVRGGKPPRPPSSAGGANASCLLEGRKACARAWHARGCDTN
ncbi:unnamed protein product, partial [Ectocarpus sp. 12 AP-2014]